MIDFDKLSHEHRAAWNEIASIQGSKEDAAAKIKKIINLFDTELLPHFKDEEDNVLTDDAMSQEILSEHHRIYDLIDTMKAGKAADAEVAEFIAILKEHIKKEDKYFGSIERTKKSDSMLIEFTIAIAVIVVLAFIFHPYFKGESV